MRRILREIPDPGLQRLVRHHRDSTPSEPDPIVKGHHGSGMPASVFVRRRASPHAPGSSCPRVTISPPERGADRRGRPCQVEALGRDGDYTSWSFETEDGAQTGSLLTSRVVRARDDEDAEPPDFDAARLAWRATAERARENMPKTKRSGRAAMRHPRGARS